MKLVEFISERMYEKVIFIAQVRNRIDVFLLVELIALRTCVQISTPVL